MATFNWTYNHLTRARHPWSPLPIHQALAGLAAHGLTVTSGS